MEYRPFGDTGLSVSVAGLGCGGSSRLGLSQGQSPAHAVDLVRMAFDQGVTFFDTAQAYGTEPIVGEALKGLPRDQVIISSKMKGARGTAVLSAADVVAALDRSLADLGTDYIDVYSLHAVVPSEYDLLLEQVVPVLLAERDKGKIRHLGITESAPRDLAHDMLERAVADEAPFAAIAVAYNMMNQRAGEKILPQAQAQGIGTVIMFAVRAVFSIPGRLQRDVKRRVDAGELPGWMAEADNPLDFLLHPEGAETLIDAAYRYVRHKSFADVTLFGTGNAAHLQSNISSLLKPPLPDADIARLEDLFSELIGFGADMPEPAAR